MNRVTELMSRSRLKARQVAQEAGLIGLIALAAILLAMRFMEFYLAWLGQLPLVWSRGFGAS